MGYLLLILVWLFNWILHAVMAPGGNLGGDAPGAAAQTNPQGSLGWSMSPPAIRNGDLMPSVDGVINIGSVGQIPTNRFPTRRLNNIVAALFRAADVNGNSVDINYNTGPGTPTGVIFTVAGSSFMLLPGTGTLNTRLYVGYNILPPNTDGSNGDFAFRSDTPGTALQRIYVKSAGAWVGIV